MLSIATECLTGWFSTASGSYSSQLSPLLCEPANRLCLSAQGLACNSYFCILSVRLNWSSRSCKIRPWLLGDAGLPAPVGRHCFKRFS